MMNTQEKRNTLKKGQIIEGLSNNNTFAKGEVVGFKKIPFFVAVIDIENAPDFEFIPLAKIAKIDGNKVWRENGNIYY